MRKLWVAVSLFSLLSIPLKAQDYPKAEIYGGYQLLLDEDSFWGVEGTHLNGFAGSGEFNVNRFFGIAGELGYGRASFAINEARYDRTQTILMAGPRFSHRGERIRIFGHVLIGVSHEASDDTISDAQRISTNNFALAVGGGMDFSLGSRISIRPFQLEVISTRHERAAGSDHQHYQLRYTGGITVKLGAVRR